MSDKNSGLGRREFLAAAAAAGTAGCIDEINSALEGDQPRNSRDPSDPEPPSNTPEPQVDLGLEVLNGENIELQPDMEDENPEDYQLELDLNLDTNTTPDRAYLQVNDERLNLELQDGQLTQEQWVLDPQDLDKGENNIQLGVEVDGQTHTSEAITNQLSFPSVWKPDLVPANDEQPGLSLFTNYNTDFKYDTIQIDFHKLDERNQEMKEEMVWKEFLPQFEDSERYEQWKETETFGKALDEPHYQIKGFQGENYPGAASRHNNHFGSTLEKVINENHPEFDGAHFFWTVISGHGMMWCAHEGDLYGLETIDARNWKLPNSIYEPGTEGSFQDDKHYNPIHRFRGEEPDFTPQRSGRSVDPYDYEAGKREATQLLWGTGAFLFDVEGEINPLSTDEFIVPNMEDMDQGNYHPEKMERPTQARSKIMEETGQSALIYGSPEDPKYLVGDISALEEPVAQQPETVTEQDIESMLENGELA